MIFILGIRDLDLSEKKKQTYVQFLLKTIRTQTINKMLMIIHVYYVNRPWLYLL